MITLDRLSVELLTEIFKLIHDSSRRTIFSLIRVNKAISEATLPFVYRECTFDFSQRIYRAPNIQAEDETPFTRSLEKLTSLLELYPDSTSAIWRGVRKVVVQSNSAVWEGQERNARYDTQPPYVPSEELVQAKWGSFVEFLARIINPREVVFDCPERVPVILLKVLEEKHLSCRLHVKNWTRLSSDVKVGDPYEEALARSPCLTSLEARFLTGGPRMDFNYSAFKRILALAPNLEAMSYITRSAGGCVRYGLGPEEEAEADREAEKFAVANPERKRGMKMIRYSSLYSSMIQSWESFFDPRNVESLHLDALHATEWMDYARGKGMFGRLKHLSFSIAHYPYYRGSQSSDEFKSGLADFLDFCSALESLSIVNYHDYIDLPALLDRHGQILRSLGLHQVESTEDTRPVLTGGDLELICSKAPRLESLELDVNRTLDPSRNEAEIYRVISTFPNLRHLTIHYDLGIQHSAFIMITLRLFYSDSSQREENLFRKIYTEIDEDFARDIWRAVRGKELEKLALFDGEPDRETGFGLPAHWVLREQEVRQRLYVRRNERDDLRDDLSAVKVERRGRYKQ
ncbi:hypothetical protein V5O48_010882 [Marasmius crinis-equi]|uniref:F-box domain-containing protein n=1 Tax=Marasmius crinis-equi TaxID=585013 RepID=A0ABR3F741_9AGAR